MSVATIEPPVSASRSAPRSLSGARPSAPSRTRPRRSGPGVGPSARPAAPVAAPSLSPVRTPRPQSCQADAAPVPPRSWRLTERGVALVLVTAVLIVTAAVAVVGLTALRVTGDGYRSSGVEVGSPARL